MQLKVLPGPKIGTLPGAFGASHSPAYASARLLLSIHAFDSNAHLLEYVCPSVPHMGSYSKVQNGEHSKIKKSSLGSGHIMI